MLEFIGKNMTLYCPKQGVMTIQSDPLLKQLKFSIDNNGLE